MAASLGIITEIYNQYQKRQPPKKTYIDILYIFLNVEIFLQRKHELLYLIDRLTFSKDILYFLKIIYLKLLTPSHAKLYF